MHSPDGGDGARAGKAARTSLRGQANDHVAALPEAALAAALLGATSSWVASVRSFFVACRAGRRVGTQAEPPDRAGGEVGQLPRAGVLQHHADDAASPRLLDGREELVARGHIPASSGAGCPVTADGR